MSSSHATRPGHGRTALVLGVNGQDGSYLAERLAHNGWRVAGTGRQAAVRPELAGVLGAYHALDLNDLAALQQLLQAVQADAVFHTAAVHGAAGFRYEDVWLSAHTVNTLSLHAALEYARTARTSGRDVQVVYFSSAKAFGALDGRVIDETTPRVSTCIYSTTKNAAADLVQYYRNRHGTAASVVWLFNHESARRPAQFFVMQVLDALAKSLADRSHTATLGSLDFWCDWGHAQEYMTLIADGCDALRGHDVVLATGHTVWARDVVTELFASAGLAVGDHITTATVQPRQPAAFWRADPGKLERLVGARPTLNGVAVFRQIADVLSKK